MKRIKRKSDLPDWFNLANYDYLTSLNENDLLAEFNIRKYPYSEYSGLYSDKELKDKDEFETAIWYLITDGCPSWWHFQNDHSLPEDEEIDDQEDEEGSNFPEESYLSHLYTSDDPEDKELLFHRLVKGSLDLRKIEDPALFQAVIKERQEQVHQSNLLGKFYGPEVLNPISDIRKKSQLVETKSISPVSLYDIITGAEQLMKVCEKNVKQFEG